MKVDGRDPFFSFLVRVVPSLLDEEKRETVASGRRLWFMGLISTNLQYKRLLVWFYAGTGGRVLSLSAKTNETKVCETSSVGFQAKIDSIR